MASEFDRDGSLRLQLALISILFSATLLALLKCSSGRRTREPTRKKTLELNEEQFRENLECARKGEIGPHDEKEVYEHFNEEEFNEGVPKHAD